MVGWFRFAHGIANYFVPLSAKLDFSGDLKLEEKIQEGDGYIDICLGNSQWQSPDGDFILEKDYRVKGEVWRVHLNDADPFPSIPHAHCVGGADRFKGCTLHLGTRELFRRRESQGRFLDQKQFDRLIELIQTKFPDIELPLT